MELKIFCAQKGKTWQRWPLTVAAPHKAALHASATALAAQPFMLVAEVLTPGLSRLSSWLCTSTFCWV